EIAAAALAAAGTELVTVAIRYVDLDAPSTSGVLGGVDLSRYRLLPNTAGATTAEHAVKMARLARAATGTNFIKLEVIGDAQYLWPDTAATIEATTQLVREGFVVLPYTSPDLVAALRLEDAGAATVMPLASPIGSGQGYNDWVSIERICSRVRVPVVVGAAVADAVAAGGTPVVLLERAQVGSAASSGAAGLLAPLVEAEGPGPFLELALAGRALFRDAAAALLRDTGVDVGYRETGTLRVAEDDGVARELRHRVSWERERGLGVRWLEPAELASREPLLHEGLSGALFS